MQIHFKNYLKNAYHLDQSAYFYITSVQQTTYESPYHL